MRWRNEPLVHFAALGLLLFGLHRLVAARPQERIVITPEFRAGLRKEALARTGRALTPAEEAAAVERFVDEEVLYREALALGLDRGDVIVRRRLVQKMELLARDVPPAPSDAELQKLLDAHRDRYDPPPRVSFRHVFFTHGDAAPTDENWEQLGDPFLQGRTWTRRSEKELAAVFGAEMAREVMRLPVGAWSAPLRSPFGWHRVRVDERLASRPATVEELRARLVSDWQSEERARLDQAALAQLRARYTVVER